MGDYLGCNDRCASRYIAPRLPPLFATALYAVLRKGELRALRKPAADGEFRRCPVDGGKLCAFPSRLVAPEYGI